MSASPHHDGEQGARQARAGLSTSDADLLPIGVIVAKPDGSATYANRAWTTLTGQREADWRGPGWIDVLEAGRRAADRRALLDVVAIGRTYEADWSVVLPLHGRRVLHVYATPSLDDDGEVERIVVAVADVTVERARTELLVHQATHDPLTGLYNRSQFLEFVAHEVDRQRREPRRLAAVLFVDVDGLKSINGRFGHDAGDRLLRAAAQQIQDALRPADVVARWGGNEFVVLCEDLRDVEEATTIAARICDAAADDRTCSLSIGMAIVDPDIEPARIVEAADRAMHEAKQRPVLYAVASSPPYLREQTASDAVFTATSPPDDAETKERATIDGLALIASAAQELRVPLTTIARHAATLHHDLDRMTPADVHAAFVSLEGQTSRLASLLADLLTIGSLRNRSGDQSEPVRLAYALADALETARPPDHVTLCLPPHDARLSSLVVPIGRESLARVIVTLLSNAYRHATSTVIIRAHGGPSGVELSVEDDGPGVPDEFASRLFEALTGRGTVTPATPGAGTGLALARAIVEAHDGRLVHEPREPTGARFTIALPVAPATPAAPESTPSRRTRTARRQVADG